MDWLSRLLLWMFSKRPKAEPVRKYGMQVLAELYPWEVITQALSDGAGTLPSPELWTELQTQAGFAKQAADPCEFYRRWLDTLSWSDFCHVCRIMREVDGLLKTEGHPR